MIRPPSNSNQTALRHSDCRSHLADCRLKYDSCKAHRHTTPHHNIYGDIAGTGITTDHQQILPGVPVHRQGLDPSDTRQSSGVADDRLAALSYTMHTALVSTFANGNTEHPNIRVKY